MGALDGGLSDRHAAGGAAAAVVHAAAIRSECTGIPLQLHPVRPARKLPGTYGPREMADGSTVVPTPPRRFGQLMLHPWKDLSHAAPAAMSLDTGLPASDGTSTLLKPA